MYSSDAPLSKRPLPLQLQAIPDIPLSRVSRLRLRPLWVVIALAGLHSPTAQATRDCSGTTSSIAEDIAAVTRAVEASPDAAERTRSAPPATAPPAPAPQPLPCSDQLAMGGLGTSLALQAAVTGRVDSSRTVQEALKTIESQLSRGFFDWAVSHANARRAHATLLSLNDRGFNQAVIAMATSDNKGWLLERYLKELTAANPRLVAEFAARLGRSARTETTKAVMRSTSSGAWGRLMASLTHLKPCQSALFVRSFQKKRIAAKSLYAGLQARQEGAIDTGKSIAGGMKTVGNLSNVRDPKGFILPTPVSGMLGFYAEVMVKAPEAMAGMIHDAITNKHTTKQDFQFTHLAQEAGLSAKQAQDLLLTLKGIYN
jgi:hypothetical protein